MKATFVSKGSNRYSLQVKPEGKEVHGNEVIPIPAKILSFEGGIFIADDEITADEIRRTDAFKKGRVFELPHGARIPRQKPIPTVRGAVDSKTIHGEAGVEPPKEPALSLKERGKTECDHPGCHRAFTEDFAGRKVRMHKLSHRRGK